MKKIPLNSTLSLWANLLELVSEFQECPIDATDDSIHLHDSLRDIFIDCLCERDEVDEFLSKHFGKKVSSGLHHEVLDRYVASLDGPEDLDLKSESDCSEASDEAFAGLSGDNFKNLIEFYISMFGSDELGWQQIQQNLFPAVKLNKLRSAYARVVNDSGTTVEPPSLWPIDEDIILVEEFEKHGPSRKAIHEIYMRLEGRRCVDEIRTRLRTCLEEVETVGKRRKREIAKAKVKTEI